jgi:thiol peroxidase
MQHMSTVLFGETEAHTSGSLPEVGSKAPDFTVTDADLKDFTLHSLQGKRVVLNIFPSINTGVCQTSVREFNKRASELSNTAVVCISKDLPFAHKAFCGAEGIENVISASQYKNSSFNDGYQVELVDSPFEGLFSRAVVVVNEDGKVIYTEQVPAIGQEPDYEAAIASLG